MSVEVFRAVRMLRHDPSVKVRLHFALIILAFEARLIVADRQHDLIGHESFFHQIQRQYIRHLPHDQLRRLIVRRLLQDLPRRDAVILRLIILHIRNRCRLDPPRVVDQELRVLS